MKPKMEVKDKAELIKQYSCGSVQFSGTDDALYERYLIFDNVIDLKKTGAREQFEALAHSLRDILSQRWIQTEELYNQANPKRIYYLSMEFLIGRSLANNITNLLRAAVAAETIERKHIDVFKLLEQEPDAELGNGGLGRPDGVSNQISTVGCEASGTSN